MFHPFVFESSLHEPRKKNLHTRRDAGAGGRAEAAVAAAAAAAGRRQPERSGLIRVGWYNWNLFSQSQSP
jgi:hypothetical protein